MTEATRTTWSFFRLSIRPWGLLTAAGLVASVATVLGFCGPFWWLFDLFSYFRMQYFLGLSIIALLLLMPRQRKTACVFAVFAVINLGTILPLYLGQPAQARDHQIRLRAMLLNVNTRLGDPDLVAKTLRDFDPDIVVLEEISSRWVNDLVSVTKAYPHSRMQTREDNFGIGILSKLPFAEAEVVYIGDAEVPSIIANVNVGSTSLRVIATHPLPPAGASYSRWRNDQLDKLPEHVSGVTSPLLLLGDLNLSPWNYHFRRLLKRTGLKDSSQGRGVHPTWPTHNPLLWTPIDHCLHSADIIVVNKEIGPNVGSDHYPVVVDFVISLVKTTNVKVKRDALKKLSCQQRGSINGAVNGVKHE